VALSAASRFLSNFNSLDSKKYFSYFEKLIFKLGSNVELKYKVQLGVFCNPSFLNTDSNVNPPLHYTVYLF
jgi:hypothetical protein